MLDKNWCKLVSRCVENSKEKADEYVKKYIDPLARVDNPEKLIGKPYESWTPVDYQMLQQVYVYSPETLEKFVNKKEIDRLWEMVKQTKQMEG